MKLSWIPCPYNLIHALRPLSSVPWLQLYSTFLHGMSEALHSWSIYFNIASFFENKYSDRLAFFFIIYFYQHTDWLSSRNFFQGAKSIVMQISYVMLLFSDQISGRGKVSEGGGPLWKKASGQSLNIISEFSS